MKKVRIVAVLAAVLVLASLLFACSDGKTQVISAYDIAVENGFVGTEEEWLLSLRGEDGKDGQSDISLEEAYESAVSHGYEGDFLTFLKEFLNVENGDDEISSNLAMLSAVVVSAKFTVNSNGFFGGGTSETSSYGSGVIYKLDKSVGNAYVITNFHVIYNENDAVGDGISTDVGVYLYDGAYNGGLFSEKKIPATVFGASAYYDIAVLKITDSVALRESYARQADIASGDPTVGQTAIAIGFPNGEGISVTKGIVSVDSQNITVYVDGVSGYSLRVLRIDVAVNSGNSGGGLFDSRGRLIGIVNAKSGDTSIDGFGYALPVDNVIAVADNIIETCDGTDYKLKKCLLGITTQAQDSALSYDSKTGKAFVTEKIKIAEVSETGICHGVLQSGDILISAELNGETCTINRNYKLSDFMLKVRVGDELKITVFRNGAVVSETIHIPESALTEYFIA